MYKLKINDRTVEVQVTKQEGGVYAFTIGDRTYQVEGQRLGSHHLHARVDGYNHPFFVLPQASGNKEIHVAGVPFVVEDQSQQGRRRGGSAEGGSRDVTPPMPGLIMRVLVEEGQAVTKRQELLVMSAMKMETTLYAPYDGTVTSINVGEGDQVMPGQKLVDIEESSTDADA